MLALLRGLDLSSSAYVRPLVDFRFHEFGERFRAADDRLGAFIRQPLPGFGTGKENGGLGM